MKNLWENLKEKETFEKKFYQLFDFAMMIFICVYFLPLLWVLYNNLHHVLISIHNYYYILSKIQVKELNKRFNFLY